MQPVTLTDRKTKAPITFVRFDAWIAGYDGHGNSWGVIIPRLSRPYVVVEVVETTAQIEERVRAR